MSNLVKIDFYPNLMDKITSFHFVDVNILELLNQIKNDKNFLIEKFYRVSKNSYKNLSSDNLEYSIIDNQIEIDIIKNFLNLFGNNTDLLELIKDNLNIDNSYCEDLFSSDDDLTDSLNITKILELKIDNKQDDINEIYNKNPHLRDNDILDELIFSE
jgi:hypothetical protein